MYRSSNGFLALGMNINISMILSIVFNNIFKTQYACMETHIGKTFRAIFRFVFYLHLEIPEAVLGLMIAQSESMQG